MAVGCIVALFLDNTIPGTTEERGLVAWRQHLGDDSDEQSVQTASIHVYDLPFGLNRFSTWWVSKYIPFLPYYDPQDASTKQDEEQGQQQQQQRQQLKSTPFNIGYKGCDLWVP